MQNLKNSTFNAKLTQTGARLFWSFVSMTDVQADIAAGPTRARGRMASATRPPTREPTRGPTREGVRTADGGVIGRGGEVLSRQQKTLQDRYELGSHLREPGWDYQWITISVVGSTDVAAQHVNQMLANGWRPVPANRPGFREWFGLSEQAATIDMEGLRLVERPMSLTEEARSDEYQTATSQVRERSNALKGGKANLQAALEAQGSEVLEGYKGRTTRVSIDAAHDAPPAGNYEVLPGQ
jgi:hypothetical protein